MKASFMQRMARSAIALVAGALFSAGALAATGGGATIHNAATLTYNAGQQVTSWVNVTVLTIGTAPEFALVTPGPFNVNAGDTLSLTYSITSNANGNDSYSLSAATSSTTGLLAGSTFSVNPTTIALGASVTIAPSVPVDADTGTVFIPTGSQTNLSAGDTVVINIGGIDYRYTVEAVRTGVIASTTGNTTTAETYTELDLTVPAASGSPPIGLGTVPAGRQVGERRTFTVDVTVTAPTVVGVDGEVDVVITGATSANDTGGNPATYDTSTDADPGNDITITVLSATVTLLKEARNVTLGTAFAVAGVTAQPGNVLEYRITATAAAGTGDAANSVLRDEIPQYTSYVPGSTTLNGVAVPDGVAPLFPLAAANNGLGINSANGAVDLVNGGTLVDGDSGVDAAVVIFQVTVD